MKTASFSSRTELLGSAPLTPLMMRLAFPSIAAQIINILYNVVDRMYIGHIADASSAALTGAGICFPIITLITAFTSFASAGGAPLAAIELGKSEYDENAKERAQLIFGNTTFLLLSFSCMLTVFFFIFKRPLLTAFGASSVTLPYAEKYLSVYICGTVFAQLSLGLNAFISAQGFAGTAMLSITLGAITNIILDPLLIFTCGLGIQGAALATIISQILSTVWVLKFFYGKKSVLHMSLKNLCPNREIITRIASLGLSPFIMTSTESVILIVFNTSLRHYGGTQGDLYVGAMTIMQSIMSLCYVAVQGFTDGVQPIISYNFGARKTQRVCMVIRRMTLTAFCCTLAGNIIISSFPQVFVRPFTSDGELLSLTVSLVPIYLGASWIFGTQMSAQRTFVALGKAKTSIFIALLRKVILLIPLALILPPFIGVNGIIIAEPVASTISALTSLLFLMHCYRELKRDSQPSRTSR